jgi:hypothetical protein
MSHRLLGYPYSLGHSPFISGYLRAHGIPNPYTMAAMVNLASQGKRDELQDKWRDLQHRAEAEWGLLLQVYSNEEAQMIGAEVAFFTSASPMKPSSVEILIAFGLRCNPSKR